MVTRVLVVEDHDSSRMALAELLTEEGFEVIEACDGQQAVEVAVAERPDVIVLDFLLPKMNGLDVLRAIGALGRPCSVIMVTGAAGLYSDGGAVRFEDCLGQAKAEGAIACLSKPLDLGRLLEVIPSPI